MLSWWHSVRSSGGTIKAETKKPNYKKHTEV